MRYLYITLVTIVIPILKCRNPVKKGQQLPKSLQNWLPNGWKRLQPGRKHQYST